MVAEGDNPLNKPGRPLGGQTGNRGSALSHLWSRVKGALVRKRQGR
jgi:hypothetical protein